jgi:hypothetical protein
MYKKIIFAFLVVGCFVSCKWTEENEQEKKGSVHNAKDVVLGGDKDKDGCLASAGYTWSKINKECIRVFTGMQLLPVDPSVSQDDAVFAAYILFDKTANTAELFLPNQDESEILKRESKVKPWTNETWQLIPLNGFQLKKEGKLMYKGDGQIGNKVSGSDDSEDVAP